jgi:hypothetical protein
VWSNTIISHLPSWRGAYLSTEKNLLNVIIQAQYHHHHHRETCDCLTHARCKTRDHRKA